MGNDDAVTDTIVRDGATLKLRTQKLRVEIVAGPQARQVVERPGPRIRVGSGTGNEIALVDPTVSRHHLTLHVERGAVRVVDAGSRNGTVVDGVRVRDAYARPDSVIVIGNTSLVLRLLDDVVDLPLSTRERFGALLGRSVAMRQLFTVLERAAEADAPVLLEGETGTGKELAAEALHEESGRADGPFVVFDCSAISANLLESELFGHVRGAFTGADRDRMGALEAADGGTLFLDEIGELPIELQPKLLRALERLEVRRVGANTSRQVDVRLIAATNRSLDDEVAVGRFRSDLFFRLAVLRVALPPLRERAGDIPLLVDHFVATSRARVRAGASPRTLAPAVVQDLASRTWPGNVRELRNAVARALALTADDPTRPSAPPPSMPPSGLVVQAVADPSMPFMDARERLVSDFARAYFEEALRRTDGNVSRAAELAGVNRKFVQRAIRDLGLRDRR
jgi:DNA-binding NtrC family response regulator